MKIFGTQLLSDGQVESSIHPPLFLVEKVNPNLQCLKLDSDYIAMISDGQFPSSLFHEIKAFTVLNRFIEPFRFQISLLERFYTVENLCIDNCEIKELFDTEGDSNTTETYVGTLSTIRNLEVKDVPSLKSYLWKQDIRVDIILPHLETLKVYRCHNLTSLGSSSALFQNLATLDVFGCRGMQYLDTSLAIKGLAQLKKLVIRNCISMKEVVASEGDEASCDIIFNRLKSLELVDLPQVESFCSGDHAFGFPCLEDMIVSGCPMLEIFCKGDLQAPLLQRVEDRSGKGHWSDDDLNRTIQHLHSTKVGFQGIRSFVLSEFSKNIERWKEGSVDFKRLQFLKVDKCNSLKYIFSASTALALVQLEEIEVKECHMMEQIIKKGAGETAIDTIMLPKLWKIRVESCPKLACFCLGSVTLKCPCLDEIKVEDCPKMYAMVSAEDVGEEKTPFFNDKVLCNNLWRLELSLTNIQKLWPDKPHTAISSNVHCLRFLLVKGCHNLEYLFPSFLIKEMAQLYQLHLSNCEKMEHVIFTDGLAAAAEAEEEEIYFFPTLYYLDLSKLPQLGTFCHGDNSETDHAPSLFNHKVAFPSLNRLVIKRLGKVRKIWQNNVTMGSFYELTVLRVEGCERLSNILPFNLVERLEKLVILKIWECESVEEIIRPNDDDDDRLKFNESHTVTSTESIELKSTTKFVFPNISFLSLACLPKLKAFYSKVHTTEWPSLKRLEVIGCNKIETFAGEYINFGETQGESQHLISFQQPLFRVTEETFPNLEELYLIENGHMKEIWHGAHPKQHFCKPRTLMFIGFPRALVNTVPDCFILSITNREKLSVEETTFNELFPSEGDEDALTLAHSKELSKKEPSLAQALYNLEILPVGECGKLKNSVQSFVSFEHLTTLEVSECHGFRYLVTLRIAKSMVQLKRMKVSDCQVLEEIVASTIGEVMDVIVFSRLESLELDRLPSLSSFCSETCTSVFPTLEEVIMRQCPKMEFFTKGNISTPMLHGVQSTKGEYVGRWEGNLNAIVQQLFVEKVFPSLEDLEISSINIQRVWNHKLPAIHTYAQNLTCLTIEGCRSLSCLFSSEMVKCFVQLKKLNIENCENAEHVIFVEGLSKEKMNQKLFRVLEYLSLKDLPKLKRFCHGNYFEFPLLTSLSIESCPALKSFVSDAQENYSDITTLALFDERVAFPCLQKLTIEGVETGETYGRSSQLTAMSTF